VLCSLAAFLAAVVTVHALDASVSQEQVLQEALGRVSTDRMMADIATLSGPDYGGRQTGTAEDAASASFVETRFASLRQPRAPVAENWTTALPQRAWKQTAPVTVSIIKDHPLVQMKGTSDQPPLQVGAQFLPVLDSPSADVEASIVFVGYGLYDHEHGYDDYAGLNVKGKIVLFLRGKPEKYTGVSTHAHKERLAKEQGAVAYLTATGPLLSAYEIRRGLTGQPSAFYSGTPDASRLPGAWISTGIAEAIVQSVVPGKGRLKQLQEEINQRGTSRSHLTDMTARLQWETQSAPGTLHNVAALIPGMPHSDETVILGAHRDHFGQQAGLLFAGADDNASGTAVILEVARILTEMPAAPRRSILLLSLSGEEQGLLGSRLYTTEPMIPLSKTVAMINVDHAGVGNGRLTIGITELDKSVATAAGLSAGLADKLDLFGFFPGGDHVPFKEAGVPTVTVVSGGTHPHFHQPSDTADTIDKEILRSAARYVLALLWQLAYVD
jgi:hypothetical protein